MWGISYPNLQMMMADSVAVLLHTDGGSPAGQSVQANGVAQVPGTHTTLPMNFSEFLKKMHEIQDHRKQ